MDFRSSVITGFKLIFYVKSHLQYRRLKYQLQKGILKIFTSYYFLKYLHLFSKTVN